MIYLLYVTETLLYVCFSILLGCFIIQMVPEDRKPKVTIHKRWLQLSILGIVFLSFMPILQLIVLFYEQIGLLLTIQNIFSSFELGKAWLFTLVIAIFFYLFVSIFPVLNKRYAIMSILFTLCLILTISWASHPATLSEWSGFGYHSIHFTAVCVWVGTLLVVSWFSKDNENWLSFLKWFTPVALACLSLTIVSGFFIMTIIVDLNDYPNSWTIDYGHSLLIKHIIIVPILIFAFINGFWAKKRVKKEKDFNPIPWVKAESILLILIFAATGVLGQQEPPHNIDNTIQSSGVSPLFQLFYGGSLTSPINIQLGFNFTSSLLAILSLFFLFIVLLAFLKKAPPIVSFIMSLLCALSVYFALMVGIS
ncbi:MAG: CopD family protein [Bacillus sp. (in: Bacteria)]|nr:CopD family protein [Bacillus sp. (in: firmicutes)]